MAVSWGSQGEKWRPRRTQREHETRQPRFVGVAFERRVPGKHHEPAAGARDPRPHGVSETPGRDPKPRPEAPHPPGDAGGSARPRELGRRDTRRLPASSPLGAGSPGPARPTASFRAIRLGSARPRRSGLRPEAGACQGAAFEPPATTAERLSWPPRSRVSRWNITDSANPRSLRRTGPRPSHGESAFFPGIAGKRGPLPTGSTGCPTATSLSTPTRSQVLAKPTEIPGKRGSGHFGC